MTAPNAKRTLVPSLMHMHVCLSCQRMIGASFHPLMLVFLTAVTNRSRHCRFRDWSASNADVLRQDTEDIMAAHSSTLWLSLLILRRFDGRRSGRSACFVTWAYARSIFALAIANNSIVGGCHDVDRGLNSTSAERWCEINAAGMMMDLFCIRRRTSPIMEISSKPVISPHTMRAPAITPQMWMTSRSMLARQTGVIGPLSTYFSWRLTSASKR